MSDLPLIERDRELSKLLQGASARTPTLLTGSPGLGRTRLLGELAERLTAENIEPLYVPFVQPLHEFLVSMATRLALRTASDSSVALRGLLWKELNDHPRILLLDDIEEASLQFYRFFERLLYFPDITVIATGAHEYGLGALQRIFWNHQSVVSLRPLTKQGALTLTQQATRLYAADLAEDKSFQEKVVQVARGNPGRIVEMCRRAGSTAYRDGDRLRFAALSIDSLTRFVP
jgi:AAA domain (dynein-related subfamily)